MARAYAESEEDRERLQRELVIANVLQTSLLPSELDGGSYEIAGALTPASEAGGHGKNPDHALQLADGDLLVLYTDGVTEARNEDRAQFGLARLTALIEAHRAAPPCPGRRVRRGGGVGAPGRRRDRRVRSVPGNLTPGAVVQAVLRIRTGLNPHDSEEVPARDRAPRRCLRRR